MASLTVKRFLAMLPLEALTDALAGPIDGVHLAKLRAAFAGRSDDFLSTPVIAALRSRYAEGFTDEWPEIEASLKDYLRDAYGPPKDNDWTPLIEATEILLSVWGPPGALIQYATEYHLLELRSDVLEERDRLFILFLFDERGWSHSPEIVDVADDLNSIHAAVASLLTHEYGDFLRDHDPAITFSTALPDALLWSTLDRIFGSSFGDWARVFRAAIERRDWVERDFLVKRTMARLRLDDGDRVGQVIDRVLAGDAAGLDDLPSDAHDIVRAACWACWEGYEWERDKRWAFWERMQESAYENAGDAGISAVEFVRSALLVEPGWSVDRRRGFTWWPSQFPQAVWADKPFRDEDFELDVSPVHVTTDVLTGVQDEQAFWLWLTRFGMVSVLGCTELDAEGTFRIHTRLELHDEIDWWGARMLHYAALTQMKEAYEYAVAFLADAGADGLRGANLVSESPIGQHPSRGPRREPHDVFTLAEPGSWLVGSGEEAPRNLKEELYDARDRWNLEFGLAPMAEAREWGVRARVWWDPDADDEAQHFANVDLIPSTHPRRGNGVIAHLNVPVRPDAAMAGSMNRREARGESGAAVLGSWGCNPVTDTLTFGTFVPAQLLDRVPGLLFNLITSNSKRAAWARGALADLGR